MRQLATRSGASTPFGKSVRVSPIWCGLLLGLGFGIFSDEIRAQFPLKPKDGAATPTTNPPAPGTRPAQPGVAPANPAAEVEPPPGLMANMKPRGEPHPSMQRENPLVTKEEVAEAEKQRNKFRGALNEGDMKQQELIANSIKMAILKMSLPENWETVANIREDLLGHLFSAGQLLESKGALRTRDFREFVNAEVVKNATLLSGPENNYAVRLQAAFLLGDLSIVKENATKAIAEEAYAPAYVPLLAIIAEPDDHPAIIGLKIVALNGLRRTLLKATALKPAERLEIVNTLMPELDKLNLHPWYHRRLLDTLASSDVLSDNSNTPIVVQKIATVMTDAKRPWSVRAEAARALGRARVSGQVKVDLLAYEIAQLARQMVDAYNANPSDVHWRNNFLQLYLAFVPENKDEAARSAGLEAKLTSAGVSQYRQMVVGAKEQILPILQLVIASPGPIPAENIEKLDQWLENNRPDDFRLHPSLEPITTSEANQLVPNRAG